MRPCWLHRKYLARWLRNLRGSSALNLFRKSNEKHQAALRWSTDAFYKAFFTLSATKEFEKSSPDTIRYNYSNLIV